MEKEFIIRVEICMSDSGSPGTVKSNWIPTLEHLSIIETHAPLISCAGISDKSDGPHEIKIKISF